MKINELKPGDFIKIKKGEAWVEITDETLPILKLMSFDINQEWPDELVKLKEQIEVFG